eukprot:symbB.v1.2.016996.t1/scaffold1310.1/size127145/10
MECSFPTIEGAEGCIWWHVPLIVASFCVPCFCLLSCFLVYKLVRRRQRAREVCLSRFYEELWDEQSCTVSEYTAALQEYGMSASEVQRTAAEFRSLQSERAGVSLRYLLYEFAELARSRTGREDPNFINMKESFWLQEDKIGQDILCPRDGRPGCALVDWIPRVHRQEQTHFLSFDWHYSMEQVRSALEFFKVTGGYDEDQDVFIETLKRMRGMVTILDTWKDPIYLKRVWTVYEQFMAATHEIPVTVVTPAEALDSLREAMQQGEKGMQQIARFLVGVDSAAIQAWKQEDEVKVKYYIKETVGFPWLNEKIRQACLQWMGNAFRTHDWELLAEEATAQEVAQELKQRLAQLELELWQQENDTVERYIRILCELGMPADQVVQKVQQIRTRQSERAGVSLCYLLSHEFARLASARTGLANPTFNDMKESFWLQEDKIGQDILCPRDGRLGCALVDWIPQAHRREQTHFMSWTWRYSMEQVCDALEMFKANVCCAQDFCSIFFYMCFFVNNQFRIIVDGSAAGSDDLENSFQQNLTRVGKMVAILDTWEEPVYLKRVWTVYEQFVACSLQLPVEFVMPSRAMASLHSHINLGKPGLKKVTTSICNVHSEQAEAWDPRDEARVKSAIQENVGFEKVNQHVRDALVKWIGLAVQKQFQELVDHAV